MAVVSNAARWDAEMRVLTQSFPAARRHETGGGTYRIDIPMTTNAGKRYAVRIYTASGYPDICPVMVVASPAPLRDKQGRPIDAPSALMHTLGTHDGFIKICHFKSELWVADNSLQLVAMKGRIWLEAYDGHLRTGQTLNYWLPEMTKSRAAGRVPPPPAPLPARRLRQRLVAMLGRLFGT